MKELVYTSASTGLRPGTSGFCTVAMSDAREGNKIVCGHEGIKVSPLERPRSGTGQDFSFMSSDTFGSTVNPALSRGTAISVIPSAPVPSFVRAIPGGS